MAVIRCEKGHFYDGDKFKECPHCKDPMPVSRKGIGEQLTGAVRSDPSVADRALAQKRLVEFAMGGKDGKRDEKTVGIFKATKGYDPVVGWLVCVSGKEKGRDYRLHVGRNFIGRAIHMDVALVDDERVSRENHCSIVYEPNRGQFLLSVGEGDGVMINGERVHAGYLLKGEEQIEIGATSFVFIPYCREGRIW